MQSSTWWINIHTLASSVMYLRIASQWTSGVGALTVSAETFPMTSAHWQRSSHGNNVCIKEKTVLLYRRDKHTISRKGEANAVKTIVHFLFLCWSYPSVIPTWNDFFTDSMGLIILTCKGHLLFLEVCCVVVAPKLKEQKFVLASYLYYILF